MIGSPVRHTRTRAFGLTPNARRYAASLASKSAERTRPVTPRPSETSSTTTADPGLPVEDPPSESGPIIFDLPMITPNDTPSVCDEHIRIKESLRHNLNNTYMVL